MDSVFKNSIREFNKTTIEGMKSKLAEFGSPKIYGGTGNCVITPPLTSEKADQCLEDASGFRFMGQRFIPDSYIFSNMVGIYTGRYVGEKDTPFHWLFQMPDLSGASRAGLIQDRCGR